MKMLGAGNWYLMSISGGNYELFHCKTKACEEITQNEGRI